MNIKVLGPGCARCKTLDRLVRETVSEMKLDADVEYIQDMARILDYNIISTPALVINEEVKVAGRVPDKKEIARMIDDTLAAETA